MTAWAFQSAPECSTAHVASASLNFSAGEVSWLISPFSLNPPMSR